MNRPSNVPETEQAARALMVSAAFALAIAGQVWLFTSPAGLWPGLGLSALALALFVASSVKALPAWTLALVVRLRLSYSAIMVGAAAILAALTVVVDVAWQRLDQTNYLLVLMLWAGSALTYATAFITRSPRWAEWAAWLRQHRAELIGLGLIALGAAALRFYQLGSIPRVIDGDAGRIGQVALATDQNPLASPFTLYENFGSVYLQSVGAALQVFGQTPFALRLIPALGGTLAVPALYLLGRRLFGVRVALFAALLLALAHAHIHFGRIVSVAYIQGTWLVPLELYFFFSGLEERSAPWLAVGGLILGFHFNIYVSAQIVAAMLVVYTLLALWLCRALIRPAARRLGYFWGGAALTALPMLAYAWRHPADFTARLNTDGTFQSGWLAGAMVETGQSALQILAGRVAHAFLSLNYYPALDFYGIQSPLLDVVTSALFVLGAGYALWRTRDPRFLLLNGYFWSATVAIGVFAIPPSADSYRMLMALPAAILLAAVGLDQIFGIVWLNEPERRWVGIGVSVFVIAAALTFNMRTYFIDFAGRCRYGGDPQTRFASYLGNYLRPLDRETTAYLLSDAVFRYGTHISVDFLSRNFPVTNVADPVTSLNPGPRMVVIASPNRADELQAWASQLSGGHLSRQYDCNNLMLVAYHVP